MNTIEIIGFLLRAAHLVGLAGTLVCLPLLYWQVPRVFLPSLGGWSSFRINRLLGLLHRFLWLTWLSGIALLMSSLPATGDHMLVPLVRDKMTLLFLLSLSGMGLDLVLRRAYMASEGGAMFVRGALDGIWMRFALALSIATFCALAYMLVSWVSGDYAPAMAQLVGIVAGSLLFATMLMLNDRWLNGSTRLTRARHG